jgi:hypothetical protein
MMKFPFLVPMKEKNWIRGFAISHVIAYIVTTLQTLWIISEIRKIWRFKNL